jgi:hypothetical protein
MAGLRAKLLERPVLPYFLLVSPCFFQSSDSLSVFGLSVYRGTVLSLFPSAKRLILFRSLHSHIPKLSCRAGKENIPFCSLFARSVLRTTLRIANPRSQDRRPLNVRHVSKHCRSSSLTTHSHNTISSWLRDNSTGSWPSAPLLKPSPF